MWRSERARTYAILEVLQRTKMASKGLWTVEGPTALALDYLENGNPLSGGEKVILRVCFDLWNGMGKATVDEILTTLDRDCLRAVADAILERDR